MALSGGIVMVSLLPDATGFGAPPAAEAGGIGRPIPDTTAPVEPPLFPRGAEGTAMAPAIPRLDSIPVGSCINFGQG